MNTSGQDFFEQYHGSKPRLRQLEWQQAKDEVWLQILQQHPHVAHIVAKNKTLTPVILQYLADQGDCRARLEVAKHPNCTAGLFDQLASDLDDGVRFHVAANPNCPESTLSRLSRDYVANVRWQVALSLNERCKQATTYLADQVQTQSLARTTLAIGKHRCSWLICQHQTGFYYADVHISASTDQYRCWLLDQTSLHIIHNLTSDTTNFLLIGCFLIENLNDQAIRTAVLDLLSQNSGLLHLAQYNQPGIELLNVIDTHPRAIKWMRASCGLLMSVYGWMIKLPNLWDLDAIHPELFGQCQDTNAARYDIYLGTDTLAMSEHTKDLDLGIKSRYLSNYLLVNTLNKETIVASLATLIQDPLIRRCAVDLPFGGTVAAMKKQDYSLQP